MRVIDISLTIQNGMQIYPGDPVPLIGSALTHEENYCHVAALQLGTHTGTHIDAPFHFLPDGRKLDAFPIERFVGRGVLIDAAGRSDNEMIGPETVQPCIPAIVKGDFAIFRTGWDRHYGTPKYLRHPFLSADCAELLVELGVSLVGIDALNVDPSSADAVSADPAAKGKNQTADYGYPVHHILLGNEILIVENLCHLDEIVKVRGLYSFLPLKLKDSDGSPIRAVFMTI